MLGWVASFGIGYLSKAQCAEAMPCKPVLGWRGRPFKISLCIHSVKIEGQDGSRVPAGKRPFVTVSAGDRTKQTEMGDWSRERGQWCFSEVITMEVSPHEEVCVSVVCNQQYDLVVAQLALSSRNVGEVCVPVGSVLPRLEREDRDIDGLIYVTPSISFDLLKEGVKTGRAELSFETKQPPQSQKVPESDNCCYFSHS